MHKVIIVSLCLVALTTFVAGVCNPISLAEAKFTQLDTDGQPTGNDVDGVLKSKDFVIFARGQSLLVELNAEQTIWKISFESRFGSNGGDVSLKDANGGAIANDGLKLEGSNLVVDFGGKPSVKEIQIDLKYETHGELGMKRLEICYT